VSRLLLACIAVLVALPAVAGDVVPVPPPWPVWQRGQPLDFTPRTHSRSVRVSDACWRTCETQCKWRFQACASAYRVNDCRIETDACDLSCLKACRAYGGPLLSITDSGP
jgi:hypothetical protein